MTSRRRIVNDDADNVCFACSPHNAAGLQLVFEEVSPGVVECLYTASESLAGAPGVVHGGIQATLLDEVLGMAVQTAHPDEPTDSVTVEFRLRYRRPAPTGARLVVRGRFLRREGADCHLEGEIEDEGGEILTRAEARWRILDRA